MRVTSLLATLRDQTFPLYPSASQIYSRLPVEKASLPIHQLIKHLGHLLPRPYQNLDPSSHVVPRNLFSEQLVVNYLAFHTLHKVAKIKLEFVNSMCQHLEFDAQTEVLKIFRFPSFCMLIGLKSMAIDSRDGGEVDEYLSRYILMFSSNYLDPSVKYFLTDDIESLFSSYFYSAAGSEGSEDVNSIMLHKLCKEIVMSYRLIFGQDPRSWKCFQQTYRKRLRELDAAYDDGDPLLPRLCGSDHRNETAYQSLECSPPKEQYSAERDFLFLSHRMIVLQQYVLDRNPSDLNTLWHDRRDVRKTHLFCKSVSFDG